MIQAPANPIEPLSRGLCCWRCGNNRFRVIYTRARAGALVRRRECRQCSTRMTTWERMVGVAADQV
jgi:transcriptional regulator NrdR family protein